ncbi:PD-(D/E)XK nuclease family protein [Halodesulfurarchaeum sp.]|uniref:PD-(D/E)XK nuclease family protein n=1 Tax=Halodesulfurarchaeum sp. TaxID=1980530 RepID=UPI002FC2E686
MTLEFISGPAYDDLQREAFAKANASAGNRPESVLWLEANDHQADNITDAWAAEYDPLRLQVESLDRAVGNAFESLTGPRTRLAALTRRQLLDEALRSLDDDLLGDAHRHRDEMLELITTLEGERNDSPDRIENLVADSELSDRAGSVLKHVYSEFHELRERTMTDEEFTPSEAYRALRTTETSVRELLGDPDVVVLSGYYELSANQQALIERLAVSIEVIALLPLVHHPTEIAGADAMAEEAVGVYVDLADVISYLPTASASSLTETTERLYKPPNGRTEPDSETLRWVEAPTPDREVRQVAKSIQNRLGNQETTPSDILVVIPGLISYREHVEDIFDAHGIEPVTFANKLLYQTDAGDAMLNLVAICKDEPGAAILAQLATNPAVSLEGADESAVADLARRLPVDDHEQLLSELDPDSRTALEELLRKANQVSEAAGTDVIPNLRSLFDHVDLETNVDSFGSADDFDARMESRAYRRVSRILDAIARVDRSIGIDDVLGRISEELDQIRVPPPRTPSGGGVEVVGPRDAFMQSYEHLYLVGMTAQDFPPNPERPRFFETLEAGLKGIEPASDRAVARYQFATMLSSSESVYITTPESSVTEEPMLESPVLDELSRVTGIESGDHELGNGSTEDVQRAISQRSFTQTAQEAVETAIEADVFDSEVVDWMRQGVRTATDRANPARSEHDGQIASILVANLHSEADRTPYSPTQLTQFARCGFQYYMERVLEIEAPEEYKLEPDPLDLGSLVHDILEAFYSELQTETGDLVDLSTYDRADLERRMLEAGEQELESQNLSFDDAFFDRWVQALFAGLATPGENEYYHVGDEDIHESAQGLLVRFLDTELQREEQPGWFEVSMTLSDDRDATLELGLPEGRTIQIGGRIDRVSIDPTADPPEAIVHDYKTGTRSPRITVDGVEFQLPLYAIAANNHFENEEVVTPVDAAFYVVDPPTDVKPKWTLRYYMSRYGGGTDEEYAWFLDTVTPQRVENIVTAIEGGAFEPTVLDEKTANCRYCDYADICDVRYHQRHAVIEGRDQDVKPGYVPREARSDSLLDELGGEAE